MFAVVWDLISQFKVFADGCLLGVKGVWFACISCLDVKKGTVHGPCNCLAVVGQTNYTPFVTNWFSNSESMNNANLMRELQ